MIKFIKDIEQRSEAWYKLKVGVFSASEAHKLIWASKITEGAMTYIETKVSELYVGDLQQVDSKAMEWGRLYEPVAKEFYQKAKGVKISEVAFIINDKYENCGVSPDGVNEFIKKGFEIKCPANPVNHLKLIKCNCASDLKKTKKEYYWQIVKSLLVSEFDTWDFISFHPDFLKVNDLRMWTFEITKEEVAKDIELLKKHLAEANIYRADLLKELESKSN